LASSDWLNFDQVVERLRPGQQVFIAGCGGESQAFIEALKRNPERASGVTFTGVLIPGVNRFCYADLHPEARMRVIFLPPEFKAAFARGQLEYLPITYFEMYQQLSRSTFDVCVLQARALGASIDLSLAHDFVPAVWPRTRCLAVELNELLPISRGEVIPRSALNACAHTATEPLHYDAGDVDEVSRCVAANICEQIEDGATLQFGLGKLQKAVLEQLTARALRVHSGMISTPLLKPLQHDQIESVCTGVVLGDQQLYRQLGHDSRILQRSVGHTHDHAVLRGLKRFVSINSIIEIDLSGQVNAEALGSNIISGGGGMLDFVRGARASGRSILALPARSAKGTRIVPRLGPGTPISIARADVDTIISEYGKAELRQLDLDRRARALIAIAHPDDREALASAWHELRKTL
jgi:acyl-CoA hydrolase